MTTIRVAETDAELEAWRAVKMAILPDERTATVEEMRSIDRPGRLVLLAEIEEDGSTVVAGTGVCDRSDVGGRAFIAARVLPAYRRRGIGTALVRVLERQAMANGFDVVGSGVDDASSGVPFAERFGAREVDRQVEQVLAITGDVQPGPVPPGLRIVTVAQRPELWRQAYYDVAKEAVKDMALSGSLVLPVDEWEGESWINQPAACFLALDEDDTLVGLASLMDDPDRSDRAEQGLTAVRRDWRHKGVALACKRMTLHYAATHGIREIFTWTQQNNADMRRVNEHLGFRYGQVSITMQGPLPLAD